MIPAAAAASPGVQTPIVQTKWKRCKITDFIKNSEILAFSNGYLFVRCEFIDHSINRKYRILNTQSGKWFIPSIENEILSAINNIFLFIHIKRSETEYNIYIRTFSTGHPQFSNILQEVPKWATAYQQYRLSDGTLLDGYISPEKVEVRDASGIRFSHDKHGIEELQFEGAPYIKENDIISYFKIHKDMIYLTVVDKLSHRDNWREFETQAHSRTLHGAPRGSIIPKIATPVKAQEILFSSKEMVVGRKKAHPLEIENTIDFEFDSKGIPSTPTKEGAWGSSNACKIPVKVDIVKESQEISYFHRDYGDRNKIPYRLSYKNKAALWSQEKLAVVDTQQGGLQFTLESKYGPYHDACSGRILNVFFDEDSVIVLRFNQIFERVESGNQYCSGPTVYDKEIETRDNFRLEFYSIDGKLLKTEPWKHTEEYDYHAAWPKYPKVVAANKQRMCLEMPTGSFVFHEFGEEKYIGADPLVKNNRYMIFKDRVVDLATGASNPNVFKPWEIVALSGQYLASATENKILVLNLENQTIEADMSCHTKPVKFIGFNYMNSNNDFIAVQFDKYIKVWHRAQNVPLRRSSRKRAVE